MTRRITDERRAKLLEMEAKATKGHWRSMREGNQCLDGGRRVVGASVIPELKRPWNEHYVVPAHKLEEVARFTDEDADFIAATRNTLLDLLADSDDDRKRIAELEAEVAQLREVLKPFAAMATFYAGDADPIGMAILNANTILTRDDVTRLGALARAGQKEQGE